MTGSAAALVAAVLAAAAPASAGYLPIARDATETVYLGLASLRPARTFGHRGDINLLASLLYVYRPAAGAGGASIADTLFEDNAYDCTERAVWTGSSSSYEAAGRLATMRARPETLYRNGKPPPDIVRLYDPPPLPDRLFASPERGTPAEATLRAVCGKWRSVMEAPAPDLATAVVRAAIP